VTGGLNFALGENGTYAGLDRFGRVVSNKWTNDLATVRDRFDYGYDTASNRLWKENTQTAAKDELYDYDGLYRLADTARGDLNAV
jgi:hypothetical protein